MNLVDFITWVKRESHYGGSPVVVGPAAANDLPTLDILTSLNARRKRIWRKPGSWPWFIEQIQFQVTPGTVVYAVTAKSGNKIDRIQNLIPIQIGASAPISGAPLALRTERQFALDTRDYYQPSGLPGYIASPRIYKNLGLVNGQWNIQIYPSSSSAFTMGGSAKGVLNTFLIGDITGIPPFSAGNTTGAANPPLDYFPDGVIEDILFEGVMADISLIQNNPIDAKSKDDSFERKIKLLAAEESDAARDDTPITRTMPRIVRRRMSHRVDFGRW